MIILVVVATTKVHIFKQITTSNSFTFQADKVVVATTKVHIFKQITTAREVAVKIKELLLLPQRYIFSSKSQLRLQAQTYDTSCCCYHKVTTKK